MISQRGFSLDLAKLSTSVVTCAERFDSMSCKRTGVAVMTAAFLELVRIQKCAPKAWLTTNEEEIKKLQRVFADKRTSCESDVRKFYCDMMTDVFKVGEKLLRSDSGELTAHLYNEYE